MRSWSWLWGVGVWGDGKSMRLVGQCSGPLFCLVLVSFIYCNVHWHTMKCLFWLFSSQIITIHECNLSVEEWNGCKSILTAGSESSHSGTILQLSSLSQWSWSSGQWCLGSCQSGFWGKHDANPPLGYLPELIPGFSPLWGSLTDSSRALSSPQCFSLSSQEINHLCSLFMRFRSDRPIVKILFLSLKIPASPSFQFFFLLLPYNQSEVSLSQDAACFAELLQHSASFWY